LKIKTKRGLAIISSLLAFSFVSVSQASANQTIDIDLNNFQSDGLVSGLPTYNINGAADGNVLTINVTNSTQGFLAYINNGAGNSINISNGGALNVTNNSGQFFGAGNLSSVAYNTNIVGSYTATITLGANSLLNPTIQSELEVANATGSPSSALGWLVLGWRMGGSDANWKQVAILNSGTPRSSTATILRTGNALRLDTQGVTTEKNNVVSCTPGKYTFLNGGSTAETAKIQSFVYTLLVNGKAVSTLSSDNFRSVASHLFPTIAGNMAGTATLDGASWNLAGMSNYSAQCQVYATQSGGNLQSVTTTAHDSVALAAAAEAAAKVQATKNMIADWAASNDELAKKYRDNRLAGKP
jgi:hypothetical protein